jgi:isochorismate synthase EntC
MIIHTIHPTLAIKSKTNDEKKFYGGLVGWETETELHLWLNIRCGMWNPKSLLYTFWTGCGITDKSNPIGEWGESNQKLKWLLK